MCVHVFMYSCVLPSIITIIDPPATSPLSVSHFQTRLRSCPDHIVQNHFGSDLVLADCVRFWPNGSGPEASRSATIIRPASDQRFQADPGQIRIGSGMFTGLFVLRHVYWVVCPPACLLGCLSSGMFTGLFVLPACLLGCLSSRHVYWVVCPPACLLGCLSSGMFYWVVCPRTNRREETVIARLRIGHSFITHSFLLKGEEPPMCIRCDED